MNLGTELVREVSVGAYLFKRRSELQQDADADADALLAGIDAGIALEICEFGRARRAWRVVVEAAERTGRSARRQGVAPRRMVARIARLRDAVDLVLFDGLLPADLAALAAQTSAKMFARAMDRALLAYWDGARSNGRS